MTSWQDNPAPNFFRVVYIWKKSILLCMLNTFSAFSGEREKKWEMKRKKVKEEEERERERQNR